MEKIHNLYLSVDELATSMGICRPKAYGLVNQPDFPKIRVGRRILIPVADLHEWNTAHLGQDVGGVG